MVFSMDYTVTLHSGLALAHRQQHYMAQPYQKLSV